RNGTEEIITSAVSEAWPVPDAALGGYTYMLEILTGIIGSRARWRTMPWLVFLFGLMIVPLGVVSNTFVIIQPIVIGTWSTLALIGAAAMLLQMPYSLDDLMALLQLLRRRMKAGRSRLPVALLGSAAMLLQRPSSLDGRLAVLQFLRRRMKAGKSLLRVFLFGDSDDGRANPAHDEFDRRPQTIAAELFQGGVTLPWPLGVAALIGIWLMFTRLSLGANGAMAHADHVIGALVLTVLSLAAAEVARALRFLLIPLGLALLITPFVYEASAAHTVASIAAGLALAGLSLPRGRINGHYGRWDRFIG